MPAPSKEKVNGANHASLAGAPFASGIIVLDEAESVAAECQKARAHNNIIIIIMSGFHITKTKNKIEPPKALPKA
jgi:hypothetical protein